MPLDQIEDLANQIKRSNDPKLIEDRLKKIVEQYDIVSFECKYSRPYFRARVVENSKPFSHVSELTYPPSNLVNEGRVNEKGDPFLYLSFNASTALAEIKAKEGDIVQISTFLPKSRPPRAIMIGEYDRISKSNISFLPKLVPYVKKILDDLEKKGNFHLHCFLYPDLFFDEILRMPNASKTKYVHSRILARLLLRKSKNFEGIMYHSIANTGSYNLAMPADKADELLKFEHTILVKVNKVFSYSMFDYEPVLMPKGKTESGIIVW